ncbi:MAG TPA: YbaK/EbsC family protein, partial [Burkholderiaceae bacterium]|nr:YbaK/EbsC family protein [Burkholderiaceae bacterium]
YVLAVVPADKQVVVDQLASMLGRSGLRLSNEQRITSVFEECERGALPPVGMAWGVETVMDDELAECDHVYLEAGDHRLLLRMAREDFHMLMGDVPHGHFCTRILH